MQRQRTRLGLQEILQDVRFGVRLLARDRGFALTAVLVLGFGIGVNNMLFTVLRAHTMRGLPIERADRVLYVSTFDQQTPDRGLSFAELQDLRAQTRSFTGIAAYTASPVAVGDERRAPDRIEAAYASANAFSALGIRPAIGRTFGEEEDRAGAAPVVVLGSGVWASRYDRDPSILGRSILINGAPFTVVGVMPPRSGFPSTAEVWLPLAQLPGLAGQARNVRTMRVFGRLHDGVQEADARAEVEAVITRLSTEFPESSRGSRARVVPINQRLLGRLTDPAWMAFMGFGCLALLVACANVANLMLTRTVDRAREIAVRTSLGATRVRVIRQLLVESAVVAGLGGLAGAAVSLAGISIFRSAIPANTLPYWFDYGMDGVVVAMLAAVALATVLIFGVVPALHATKADVNHVIRGGGRGVVHASGSRRWTAAFMALELGVTVMMLAYLVTDVQAPSNDLATDAVVATDDVLTGNVTLPPDTYATGDRRRQFYTRLESELRALPSVSSVALASHVPRRGANPQKVEVEGRPLGSGEEAPTIATVSVGPRFFETLGVAIERGRDFTEQDAVSGANVIVSARFVELFLSDRDPIGSRVRFVSASATPSPGDWLTVVGVAQQVEHRDPQEAVAYVPFAATPPATASVLLRIQAEPGVMTARVRDTMHALDPNLPVYRVMTMAQVVREQTWNGRVASNIVRSITIIAFLFCLVGLYAVTAHAVAQRTNEIGVRMALGARPAHVTVLIVKRTALHVALGFALGVPGVIAWSSFFGSGRVDTGFATPSVIGSILLILAAGMVVACWVPARRALRLDPVSALRSE